MNITEQFGLEIETRTFDGDIQDPWAITFQVFVGTHLAWQRIALRGTSQKVRNTLALHQRAEALHLHARLQETPS